MAAESADQEIVIVTGASSGIGAATARDLAQRGFHVLAGVRREEDADTIRAPGVEPVIIDITNPNQIEALARRVHGDALGRRLRALVNNAGIGVNAPVETFPMEHFKRLFDVNLFGHVAVTQRFLPALIRSRGRVVNISSIGGKIAMATYGPYAGAKFALEAVSDALRREVGALGVSVVVVEPGAVRTKIAGHAIAKAEQLARAMTPEQKGRYAGLVRAVTAQAASFTKSGLSADAAAKVIARAVTARTPRTRYTIGSDAALMAVLVRLLPDRALDRLFSTALRRYWPRSGVAT